MKSSNLSSSRTLTILFYLMQRSLRSLLSIQTSLPSLATPTLSTPPKESRRSTLQTQEMSKTCCKWKVNSPHKITQIITLRTRCRLSTPYHQISTKILIMHCRAKMLNSRSLPVRVICNLVSLISLQSSLTIRKRRT